MNDAVRETLLARVYDVATESPLTKAKKLSSTLGSQVYLKREDLQPVHSFKLRGAYNKMVQLSLKDKAKGVIAASAGNHAQGVALSAQKLNLSALIVMPQTTPAIKVEAVKSYGADVILFGDNYTEAYEHCLTLVEKTGRTFVHPFDDLQVIAGQGTIGREILEQLATTSDIFVPVGGGGLIAGVAQYVKALRSDIKIIGVEPKDSNAMQAALTANKRVSLEHVGIFADGVAVKQVGSHTFALAKKYVDEIITVDNDQICAAIKSIFEETRSIVEPAGALGVAGIVAYAQNNDLQTSHCVTICSGANMTFERLQFIAERTLIGSGKEALFAVDLAEQPGALQTFCQKVVNGNSISEFSYRLANRKKAIVFVGITFHDAADKSRFSEALATHKFNASDLSLDETAKEHVRHMVGGSSKAAENERIYEVYFPERPGALGDFLAHLGKTWNISLFHYRGQGGDTGKVLVGFEAENKQALEAKLRLAGYDFIAVKSKAVTLFL